MRQGLRRYGTAALFGLIGAALLLTSAAASLGYLHEETSRDGVSSAPQESTSGGGLELAATLDVDTPLVPVGPMGVRYDPSLLDAAKLPGLSVDRDVTLEQAGFGVNADLDLASGSHTQKSDTSAEPVHLASMRAFLTPNAAPVVAAAAVAFTLAGAIAFFWSGAKSAAARYLALPIIGLYAKISRAEVFDNTVRERIFQAIRQNPGASASDLARVADVSWGTTIYHLDVLEQTRMVTSLRKGRYRRYFENGAALATTKDVVAILRNPVTANVVDTLRTRPGVTQKDLALATHMSPQALHWHLARLVEGGLVRKEREGRVVRHFVSA